MTSTADRRGEFNARSGHRVLRIGGMNRSRAVAVLALHAGELRGFGFADESRRQTVTDGMAWQTRGIGLTALRHEQWVGKRAEVAGVGDGI